MNIAPVLKWLFVMAMAPALWAQTVTATRFSVLNEPKYAEGFTHFDYVNPRAPKGGSITLAATGTYDNFHAYALRGHRPGGTEYLYDSLMTGSEDEIGVYYPLIAEKIEYPDDLSSIIVTINPKARDQGGQPITAEDAAFSFRLLDTKGVPQFHLYYGGIEAVVLDEHRVRFIMPGAEEGESDGSTETEADIQNRRAANLDMILGMLSMPIFPKRFWVDAAGNELHNFSEPLLEPPLGTGPYRIDKYVMGQQLTLSRVKDYWAADLPSRAGYYNIDEITYDYYRDEGVAFEAFKAGEYDIRVENSARRWAEDYTGKIFDSGRVVRREIPHEIPQGMQGLVFNTQRPPFTDRRVREALSYFLDFEWMNKNLFYNQYTRTRSFFQNTEYAARGLPDSLEIAVLEPVRDAVPPEVFTTEFRLPVNSGSGDIRDSARKAVALLKEAGWELKRGRMIDSGGAQMSFELLINDVSSERIAIPVQRNMAKYGIEMRIRMVDDSQYINRVRNRDFDMLSWVMSASEYPSPDLMILWHSEHVNNTWNVAGVMDDAVDYLTESIARYQGDKAALVTIGRALDRVLTWNYYVIPQWHIAKYRIAHTDKFGFPAERPTYGLGTDTWWVKPPAVEALGRVAP
ncbi:MAG: extracellular solute-binding protein [Spirochaetaceae bacterium]|jgi:microcin C transport system substrate-binding protein|nr:extracellular solute-binding protein [Spirochaetaceae bacterium]